MALKRKFATTTAEDIQELRGRRHEYKTKCSTTWGVNLFKGNLVLKPLHIHAATGISDTTGSIPI